MGSRTDGRRSTNTPSFRDNFDCRNKTRLSRYTIFLTKVATSFLDPILYTNHFNYVQGYSKRMKLQRRLYGILYCLVSYMIPWNCKLMSFLSKSFKKAIKRLYIRQKAYLNLGIDRHIQVTTLVGQLIFISFMLGTSAFLHT